MFLNTKALVTGALLSFFSAQSDALAIRQVNPADLLPHRSFDTRDTSNDIRLMPIKDPGELTGKFVKRVATGENAFDPSSRAELFWGAYAGDHIVTANFTLGSPTDDELLLPIENFAQRLKSISCGPDVKGMSMTFSDKAGFDAAQKKWKWVDEKDINHFIIITEMDQCYKGDDRSPYLVKSVAFDEATLTAKVDGAEQPWKDVVKKASLKISNEYVNPDTVNVTHPHLIRRDSSKLSLAMSKSVTLFDWKKDSKETAGLGIKANVHVQTGGAIMTDLDLEWGKAFGFIPSPIPEGIKADLKPSGLWGSILLGLELDGKLGKEINFAGAEIEIPVAGFKIAKIISIGPMAGVGVHFGSSAIEGHAQVSVGSKAKIPDSAVAHFESKDKSKNKLDGWKPTFEKLEPRFTAEIKAGLKAWAELSFKVKAEALDFGFEAGIVAEVPYFEANVALKSDTKAGVCNSKKAVGIEVNCETGISVDLEMDVGKLDNDPVFEKNLFQTSWPLFKTCIGFGKDISTTSLPPVPTGPGKDKSETGSKPASNTAKPTSGTEKPASNTAKPTSGTAKPTSGTDKPSSGSSKPTSGSDKPTSGSAKPTATSSGSQQTSSGSAKPTSAASSGSIKPSSVSASGSGSVKPSSAATSGATSGSAKPSSASASGSVQPSTLATSKVAPSSGAPSANPTSTKPAGPSSASGKPTGPSSASGKPSGSATGSSAAPSATDGGDGGFTYTTLPSVPKFEGAVPNCTKWYQVKAGETCTASGLSTPDLCKLNKGLDAQCNNFMSGIAYCVKAAAA
ncbi:hypothetical protein CC80DRAFT_534543 [Byssothecium circinans]|uniref:LysM domain-containing protein n=1 Tax=Byssothecium circinans TaxID=147558 RepID=A0A6A5U2L3_9PLEO|nr:hypothetical protein CC80DRAFT_534543 [Byssothecium circinans]